MPFELINTSAIIQKLVNNTLHKNLDIFIIAYLNDILIFSKTENEHIQYIKTVLKKLRAKDFRLKPKKYK